jgi:hypothetical protein
MQRKVSAPKKKVTGHWRKFKLGASYFVLNKYYHYIKEVSEVGGACTSHGKYRNPYKVLAGKKWRERP